MPVKTNTSKEPSSKAKTLCGEDVWRNYADLVAEEARELTCCLRKYYDVERDGEERFVELGQLTSDELLTIVSVLKRIAQAASRHSALVEELWWTVRGSSQAMKHAAASEAER